MAVYHSALDSAAHGLYLLSLPTSLMDEPMLARFSYGAACPPANLGLPFTMPFRCAWTR